MSTELTSSNKSHRSQSPPVNPRRLFLESLPDPRKLITKALIKAGDTVLEALGKLQGQLTARFYYETSEVMYCCDKNSERFLMYEFDVSELMQGDYILSVVMIVSGTHSGSDLTFTPMLNYQDILEEPIVLRCPNPEHRIPITFKKLVTLTPGKHQFYVKMERSDVTFGKPAVLAHSGSIELSGYTL